MPWMCIEQGWAGIPFCLKNSWEIPTNLQIFKRLLLTPWMCNRGKLLLRSLRIPWKRSEGNFLIKIIIETSKGKLLLRILSMCSEGYYQLFSRSLSIPWMCSEGRRRQCCCAVKWSVSWLPVFPIRIRQRQIPKVKTGQRQRQSKDKYKGKGKRTHCDLWIASRPTACD